MKLFSCIVLLTSLVHGLADCADGSACFGGDCCCGTAKGHPQTCFCKDREVGFTCCGCSWCEESMTWCWNGNPGGNPVCGGCDQGQTCDYTGGDAATHYWPSLNCSGGQRGKLNMKEPITKRFSFSPKKDGKKKSLPATNGEYYEKPVNGTCNPGEIAAEVSGINGDFCSPSCASSDCPDAPAGVTALPECALQPQGASEPTNCALACGGAAVCPSGSKCTTVVPGTMYAVCMYPETAKDVIAV